MVNLSAAACLAESVLTQALRLTRERWPQAVVIEGPAPRMKADLEILGDVCKNLSDGGYYVAGAPGSATTSPARPGPGGP